MITHSGSQPSTPGPADNFTGDVRVQPLFAAEDTAPYTGASRAHRRPRRAGREWLDKVTDEQHDPQGDRQ